MAPASDSHEERSKATRLAVLTALISVGTGTSESLSALTSRRPDEIRSALRALQSREWVTRGAQGWQVSLLGYEEFYRALGEIRDVLAPDQNSATLPFTLRTTWQECLCFNYAVEPRVLRPLVSDMFDLVTLRGKAFLSVTAASLSGMRPTGLPDLTGKNFSHLTLRAVVRFRNQAGIRRTGYEFVDSITNSQLLTRIGNSVTEYKFHDFRTGSITFLRQGTTLMLAVEEPTLDLKLVTTVDTRESAIDPPAHSVFETRTELDKTIIDHDIAFGYSPDRTAGAYVLTIEREPWRYRFVEPQELYFSYFQEGAPFDEDSAVLDSVLHVEEVAYRWRPLRFEARSTE